MRSLYNYVRAKRAKKIEPQTGLPSVAGISKHVCHTEILPTITHRYVYKYLIFINYVLFLGRELYKSEEICMIQQIFVILDLN